MKDIDVDLVIIGGGPAGLAAGIYATMDKADFLLVEAKEPAWFMENSINSHNFVDGFTGVKEKMSGTLLKKSFIEHYQRLGGKFLKSEVVSLSKNDTYFIIKTKKETIKAFAVIVASGTQPRILEVENGHKFSKYIHFDCVSESSQYLGKKVVVVGGRNSGAVAACYLHDMGCEVSLIEIKNELQAKEKYKEWLKKRDIKIYTSSVLKKMMGDEKLEKIIFEFDGENREMLANGVFFYAGRVPLFNFMHSEVATDRDGYVLVDAKNQTSLAGLFAAGDITPKLKQVITACGDGANAYYFANKYIQGIKNETFFNVSS